MLFLFLFFGFIFKKSNWMMKDCCLLALLNETIYLYETDGFRKIDSYRENYYYLQLKKRRIEEFIVLMMKHTN